MVLKKTSKSKYKNFYLIPLIVFILAIIGSFVFSAIFVLAGIACLIILCLLIKYSYILSRRFLLKRFLISLLKLFQQQYDIVAYDKKNNKVLFCNNREFLEEVIPIIEAKKVSAFYPLQAHNEFISFANIIVFKRLKETFYTNKYEIFDKARLPIIAVKGDKLVYSNFIADQLKISDFNNENTENLKKILTLGDEYIYCIFPNQIARTESIINKNPLPTIKIDKNSQILAMNKDFKDTYGAYLKKGSFLFNILEEYTVKQLKDFIHPSNITLPTSSYEVKVKLKSERYFLLIVSKYGKDFICQLVDITKYKKIETDFIHSQKMQAVGQLAGGIAHDFNNLLTAMIGFCDLLLMRHSVGDPSFVDIMQVKQNANRAANLVKQLLVISRKQEFKPQKINVVEALEELSTLIKRLIGEKINFKLHNEKNIELIEIDPSQFEQVIINLVVNARDAILATKKTSAGSLSITTKIIVINEQNYLNQRLLNSSSEEKIIPGSYLQINIQDNGEGIKKEILNKILEPYFSTKEIGNGTGLGLSTVHNIIKHNNGYLLVDTEIGKGTTFTILFKACEGYEEDRSPSLLKEETTMDLTGEETILLIEDEAPVRMFSANALENKGYKVLQASSAEDANSIILENGEKLSLIITDVMMPGLDGPEFINQIKTKIPKVKILFISGYGEEILEAEGFIKKKVEFLPKPFSLQDLVIKVRKVLNGTKNH